MNSESVRRRLVVTLLGVLRVSRSASSIIAAQIKGAYVRKRLLNKARRCVPAFAVLMLWACSSDVKSRNGLTAPTAGMPGVAGVTGTAGTTSGSAAGAAGAA